jgi:hypothetical protein
VGLIRQFKLINNKNKLVINITNYFIPIMIAVYNMSYLTKIKASYMIFIPLILLHFYSFSGNLNFNKRYKHVDYYYRLTVVLLLLFYIYFLIYK